MHAGVHGAAAAGGDRQVTGRWPHGAEGQPGGTILRWGWAWGAACQRQIAVP